jgi:NhaA family Na+:H+ antiporter
MSSNQKQSIFTTGRINSTLRKFLHSEASGGLLLMAVAAVGLAVANSPFAPTYFSLMKSYIGPLSVQHWVNDALMAIFFLMVGLEIKREMLDGQLSSWPRRILPGVAALGGMMMPAAIYVFFNINDPAATRGWAIPTATDIAFALGVLSLLGPRVPVTLKVFLTALAIIDDLGAVVIIALFYTADINLWALAGAALVFLNLCLFSRIKVVALWPYLMLGAVLWFFVLKSGVHATIAGVLLALTVPIKLTPGTPEANQDVSPLHKLEHALHRPVSFIVIPIFGFVNAGVSFSGLSPSVILEPLTLGIGLGLVLGKLIGVFGSVFLLVKAGIVEMPGSASWAQTFGVSLLCGIGFTMSLFVALLAFDDPVMQDRAKLGILAGSIIAGIAGYFILRFAPRRQGRQYADVIE